MLRTQTGVDFDRSAPSRDEKQSLKRLQIYFKVFGGPFHPCEINSNTTIRDICRLILLPQKGVLREHDFLIEFEGRCLASFGKALVDYGVRSGSSLVISISSRAGTRGCFSFFRKSKTQPSHELDSGEDEEAVAIDISDTEVKSNTNIQCTHPSLLIPLLPSGRRRRRHRHDE